MTRIARWLLTRPAHRPLTRTRRSPLGVETLEGREAPSEALGSVVLPGADLFGQLGLGLPAAAATTARPVAAQGTAVSVRRAAWWDEPLDLSGAARGRRPAAPSLPPVSLARPSTSPADEATLPGPAFGGRPATPAGVPPADAGSDAVASPAGVRVSAPADSAPAIQPAALAAAPVGLSAGAGAPGDRVEPAAGPDAESPPAGESDSPALDDGPPAMALRAATLHPSHVLDANKGAVLTEDAPNRDFSAWAVDLKAQVSGAAVASYAWDVTNAPDATGVTGTTDYRLQFTWGSFTGAARGQNIALTTTFAGGGTQTQTFAFAVDATDSPAWAAAPPTTAASFPAAVTEDVLFNEPAAQGATYALGLASGKVTTTHALPAYNPDVPALALVYAATAADPRPVVKVRHPLPAGSAVPATLSVKLTFDGVASAPVVYDTSRMNPGGVLEFAVQADATGLATGRYDYSVAVTGPQAEGGGGGETGGGGGGLEEGGGSTTVGGGTLGDYDATYTGRLSVVNDAGSAYGAGWRLSGVRQVVPVADGLLVVSPGGVSQFRPGGGLVLATLDGPGDFSDLVVNADGTYTQSFPDGTTIDYSAAGLQTAVTDRNGNATAYGYDAGGTLTTITDEHGLVTSLTYDAGGKLASVTDPASRSTGFTVSGGRLATITGADTHAWTYAYDAAGKVTTITDPTSRQTVLTYGAGGRGVSARWGTGVAETVAPQAVAGLAVAPQGTATNPAPAVLAAAASTVHTDRTEDVTEYRFDWSGFGSVARADAPDGGVRVTLHDLNGLAWLGSDPLGRRTRAFFDGSASPTTSVNADDTFRTATYNGFAQPLTATDELGRVTTFAYDPAGNRTGVTDPLGKTTTSTFNPDGTVATVTDPLGLITSLGYDARDRLTTQTNTLGHAVTYGYSAAGNKTSGSDALGHTTTATFDALNRPLTATDARGGVTTNTYDAAGRLLTLTDPAGNVTTYAYSPAVNMAATITDPRGSVTTNAYDADGHLIAVTDRNGRVRQFSFDAVGRPTGETWQATVGGPTTYTLTGTYDLAGQLVSVADPFSSYAYTFDARGRVVTEDNAGTPGVPNVVLTNGYDAAGNLTSVTDNLGGQVGYSYTARNELAGASQTVGGTLGANAAYGYDDTGRPVSATRREGTGGPTVGTTFGYDNANRLTGIAHTSSAAGALSAFAYGYDIADRLTSYTGPDGGLTYSYDKTNQLTGVAGAATESFGYDLNGNRNTTGYTTGTGNRLLGDGTYTYGYDAESNQTTKTRVSDGQVTTYTYDHRNRLTGTQVKTAGGVLLSDESHTYDSQNRRIGVKTDGVQGWTAYQGHNAWSDFNSTGTLQTRYLFGAGMDSLIARTSAAGVVGWYLTDNLGSVRQIASTAGAVVYSANYTAFGQVKASSGIGGDRYGYAGREWSRVTGDGYYRARQYDPVSGRFLNQDPMSFAAMDANLNRYVGNDPVLSTDPSGNFSWRRFGIGVGVAAAVIVGGVLIVGTGGLATPIVVGIGVAGAGASGYVAGEYAQNDGQAALIGAAGGVLTVGAIYGAGLLYGRYLASLEARIAHHEYHGSVMMDRGMREQAMAHATDALNLARWYRAVRNWLG